ncbi:MAG: hypothetical protein HOC74_24640 [Gemmatimonadetes bacterium]|jgi:hypothetical protein|nr:hypothetical protein [Gemmatimonadota bacterium]
MRSIFVGCEYAGKSTLIQMLADYYRKRNLHPHMDDHFSIPDSTLSPESRKLMMGLPRDIIERMQRMQIQYHVDIIKKYKYPILGGWNIEEAVYTGYYGSDPDSPYYENYAYTFHRLYEAQVYEARLADLVMFHVTASDEAIARRMRENPHEYPIVKEKDIPEIKKRFAAEVEQSLFTCHHQTVVLDTTDKTPQESFDELLALSEPLITPGEIALRALPVPEDDCVVKYENGVRKWVPKEEG